MKNSLLLVVALLIFVVSCITACFKPAVQQSPEMIDFSALPLKNLSEYGFFVGEINDLQPSERVLPYEPISPLFTDYAFKSRFVWMPDGTTAVVSEDPTQPFDFPEKAMLVKNFYYPADFSKPTGDRKILETRLLVREKGGWKAYPYVWNEEQTEATYKVTGGVKNVAWTGEDGKSHSIKYVIPNKNQCKSCHNQHGTFQPIGPKVKQLNYELTYANGEKINQLAKWESMGYLKHIAVENNFVNLANINDPSAPLEVKARSYLEANCAHCHNKAGPASTSGLYLNIEESDPFHWGVLKSPIAAGVGAGSHKFAIAPGHGNESIIPYRMNSTDPGVMMPEIGRVSIHKEGVALITRWIDEMH